MQTEDFQQDQTPTRKTQYEGSHRISEINCIRRDPTARFKRVSTVIDSATPVSTQPLTFHCWVRR